MAYFDYAENISTESWWNPYLDVKIFDADTGDEIEYVKRCDTKSGLIHRFHMTGCGTCSYNIAEYRRFRVVFPSEGREFIAPESPPAQSWRDQPPLL